jgi:hypothetical protein
MTIGGGRRTGKTVKLLPGALVHREYDPQVIIARWCRRHLRKPTGHGRIGRRP